MRTYLNVFVATALLSLTASAAVPPGAVELRNRGLAELENEKPELAEQAYRQLTEKMPKDPLGFGNLAIAELRQQKNEAAMASIERALELAPGRADLLAIKSEVLQWTGDLDGALTLMKQAADAAPENLEILYAAYQLAATLRNEAADAVGLEVLKRLARLRPENLVVLLQLGQKAIAAGDRRVTSGVFLRVEQLLWQVDPIAQRALGMVTTALEGDDVAKARVPAIRLENVLKVSAMYRESLRELKTGIQGIPIKRFLDEPEVDSFGEPLSVELAGTRLDERATAGRALVAGDFDGDGKPDLARIRDDGQSASALEIRGAAGGWKVSSEFPAPDLTELLAVDLDNDGDLDLAAFGRARTAVWLGNGDGTFSEAADALGMSQSGAATAVVIDFDIEGDLDLALAGGTSGPGDLYRNSLDGPLERIGAKSLPRLAVDEARGLAASDLDRDGDLDLVIAHARGLTWIDNLRQGRFVDASARAGLVPSAALATVVSADLDNDGLPDLIGGGRGITAWHNSPGPGHDLGGSRAQGAQTNYFKAWQLPGLPLSSEISALHAFDADNDGRLDLATAGTDGVQVLTQQGGDSGVSFAAATVSGGPASATAVVAADLDLDGDLDLAVAGPDGLHWLENRGGNRNRWLVVRLRGLDKGNSKNNFHGVGSVVEVSAGQAYQFREAAGDAIHIGIGNQDTADVLRVVWTNGVPQNRLQVEGNQRLVEEQLLKGSCPFVYAWNGNELAFETDLLWGAPLGLPVAPDAWAFSDPQELVRLDAALADDNTYRLRITEELWEAAYFDYIRLWVVDHPAEVEVASSLKVVPGMALPERVLASRDLHPVVAAWDGQGHDATATVRHRDEVYAAGYTESRYQGTSKPWTFTFDLGEAPAAPVRLHLDGWIFPADASLNLAVAQRGDLPYLPPRLEVETALGWQELIASMGHPAGKTKTMVVDTPALPAGARKLRIVTSLWLHWDRIAWTTATADDEPIVRARLAPAVAEARYRGFSAMVREAPNAPHTFDYQTVTTESPWLPFPGHYSRYGDVRQLLAASDDLSVILAPGDEIALTFDAGALEPPPEGFLRTVFLESHGWDKDADRNTWEAQQLEPLPFHAMTGYPFGPGESYPDTPTHRTYRREWLTRELR